MNRRPIFGSIRLAASAYAKPGIRDLSSAFGNWMSFQRRFKDGRLENTYGDMPVGRIIYDKAGRFAAQLMRRGRRSAVPSGGVFTADNPSAEEIREAVTGFFAYYGKFAISVPTVC